MKDKLPEGAILITGEIPNRPTETRPRCFHTNNPCGTDTWAVGYVCPCVACQEWFHSLPKKQQDLIRWGVGGDPLA